MAVLLADGDAVIPIPGIGDGFPRVGRDRACDLEWRSCPVGFSEAMSVEWGKVDRAASAATVLSSDYHAVTPGGWLAVRYTFYNSELLIAEEIIFHLLLRM